MSPDLRRAIDELLQASGGNKQTYFSQLKEYPPAAKISSLKRYLERYNNLVAAGINAFEEKVIDTAFLHYIPIDQALYGVLNNIGVHLPHFDL